MLVVLGLITLLLVVLLVVFRRVRSQDFVFKCIALLCKVYLSTFYIKIGPKCNPRIICPLAHSLPALLLHKCHNREQMILKKRLTSSDRDYCALAWPISTFDLRFVLFAVFTGTGPIHALYRAGSQLASNRKGFLAS
jgi:hypothetical protein